MSKEKKILKIMSYEFKVTVFDNDTTIFERTNDGFNHFELLGLMERTKTDIIKQIEGNIKPTIIKRKIIK